MADGPDQPQEIELDLEVAEEFADQIDADALTALIRRALQVEGINQKVALSIVVTDDQAIRALNRTYRGIDEPTDVLSFPLLPQAGKRKTHFVVPPDDMLHLGDIVISFPRVIAQAKEYGHSVKRELGYLTIHGLLHLLGYDHKTKSQRELMRAKEEEILADLSFTRCQDQNE